MDLSAFRNLFGDLQEYVVGILNQDEIIDAMGAKFVSENALDIEYEVKDALAKTGMACVVMTPTATYQGHNGIQQTFTCDELTLQIVENPVVHRPWLKKNNLKYGTGLDVAKAASDRLAGPQGGHFGQFTTKRIREAEQSGLLAVTATFGCTVYETLSAVPSGDISGHWVEVPFVRMSELSDWIDDYLSTHMPVPEVSGYLPLSGGQMSGDISFQPNNNLFWGDQNYHDAYIMGGSPGLIVYNDADEQWVFKSSVIPETDDDVLRRRDLSAYMPLNMSQNLNVRMNGHVLSVGGDPDTPGDVVPLTIDDFYGMVVAHQLSVASGIFGPYIMMKEAAGQEGLGKWNSYILEGEAPSYLGSTLQALSDGVQSAISSIVLSDYLPLSGGQMSGGISWDYGGMGGPKIYGPYNPQQLLFQTTYAPDAGKAVLLDFGRIDEADGQRTLAFVEDIQAALGDISALIHES